MWLTCGCIQSLVALYFDLTILINDVDAHGLFVTTKSTTFIQFDLEIDIPRQFSSTQNVNQKHLV